MLSNGAFRFACSAIVMVLIQLAVGCSTSQLNPTETSNQATTRAINSLPQEQFDRAQCGTTRGMFRGTWFDYYERSLSYADCGMWQRSAADLREALEKRSQDTRNAYEVGMHFSDYFPHRELGVALYYLGQFAKAARELETSLEQFPTSKAELYFKRAQLKRIEADNLDKEKPVIAVISPRPDAVINASTVEVTGKVTDDSYVEKIEVNGVRFRYVETALVDDEIPVRIERVASEMPFTVTVPLTEQNGKGIIRVLATDITGKQAEYLHEVRVDRNGPVIALAEAPTVTAGTVRVKGQVSDPESGPARLRVNGRDVRLPPGKTINLAPVLDSAAAATVVGEDLVITAQDQAGNQTVARLAVKGDGSKPAPLRIEIEGGLERFTQEASVYLQGTVASPNEITALTVNADSVLKQPARQVYFGFVGDVALGENRFQIVASDAAGHQQQAEVKVIRDAPAVQSVLERLLVAQVPFSCNEMTAAPCRASAGLYEKVLAFMAERKRFRLIERLKLDEIIREQVLCRSGITEKCALTVGNLLFAEGLFVGDVIERRNWQGNVSVEVNARMVDVETRDILMHVDAYGESVNHGGLQDIGKALAIEISDAFPLVEGEVIAVSGDRLTLDLTSKDRVWEKMPILVYQDGEIIANRIREYRKCGAGRLAVVRSAASFAEIAEDACRDIWPGVHKVITK